MFYALVANRSKFDNGMYDVPQGAGFGLELDRAMIGKYRV
jgi:D-arabinonate dehydratase